MDFFQNCHQDIYESAVVNTTFKDFADVSIDDNFFTSQSSLCILAKKIYFESNQSSFKSGMQVWIIIYIKIQIEKVMNFHSYFSDHPKYDCGCFSTSPRN